MRLRRVNPRIMSIKEKRDFMLKHEGLMPIGFVPFQKRPRRGTRIMVGGGDSSYFTYVKKR